MYNQARSAELKFFSSGRGIRDAAEDGALVKLQPNGDYTLDGVSYPYVRPATRTFVQRLAAQYRAACGERLVVTSATRPLSLHLINSVSKTVHPTGMAVDLRRSNRRSCRDWLRGTLLDLEGEGLLEATEEHHPPHFHVAVFPGPYSEYLAERSLPTPSVPKKVAVKSTSRAKKSSSSSSAKRHVVRGGESLWGIARRNGTTVAKLKAANHLRTSTIRPGQTLVLP
jgi:LysM repeat protein